MSWKRTERLMDTIKVRNAVAQRILEAIANAVVALQQLPCHWCVYSHSYVDNVSQLISGVSLRQMVQFGEKPSTGTLFRASQFLSEELPIRLAHRVQELNELPDGLNEMPSICRVRDWYAQSFEVRVGGAPVSNA
jgi:hypothetical protein